MFEVQVVIQQGSAVVPTVPDLVWLLTAPHFSVSWSGRWRSDEHAPIDRALSPAENPDAAAVVRSLQCQHGCRLSCTAERVVNNAQSAHAKLKSINIGDCRWTSGFWADKFSLCEAVMVPHMGELLKGDTGHAYNNFKIAAGLQDGDHQGMHWHDGDFYKWMESAMYVYAINQDPKILAELDEIIDVIGLAQEDDGYLSTQITLTDAKRWSNRKYHELYNSGHLLTSACIHHRVTGQRNFLEIAVKHADYLCRTFRPRPGGWRDSDSTRPRSWPGRAVPHDEQPGVSPTRRTVHQHARPLEGGT